MKNNEEVAVFAGGCFWCTEVVFQHIKGVVSVISGYTGGTVKNPAYREICTGRTGHAEGVKIEFNTDEISFTELLEIFFATHDPTTLDSQENDKGTQYRSAIFYTSEAQKEQAEARITLLEKERVFDQPIVTEIRPLDVFYTAEVEHQRYYDNHQTQPYCQVVINPKLKKLRHDYTDKLKQKLSTV